MKKIAFSFLIALFLLVISSGLAERAAADHLYASPPETIPDPDRINLVVACFILGITERTFPADKGFFVAHGWFTPDWGAQTPEQRRGFMYTTSRFDLSIDGQVQNSALHTSHFDEFAGFTDVMSKVYVIEDHQGLTGDHVLLGQWYLDGTISTIPGSFQEAVLEFDCTLTVHFL